MRDYMAWLKVGHAKMLEHRQAYEAARDDRAEGTGSTEGTADTGGTGRD